MAQQKKLDEGAALFNSGKFFECHEAFEEVWNELRGDERRWMQGVIQVAVAMHHHSNGNLAGARSLLARAGEKLSDAPDHVLGIVIPPLRTSIRLWRSSLEKEEPLPPVPHLEIHRSG